MKKKNVFLILAGWISGSLKVTLAQAGMPVLLNTFYDSKVAVGGVA